MKRKNLIVPVCLFSLLSIPVDGLAKETTRIKWRHLSTVNGDLPVPNAGKQQTASIVFDVDQDGVNDFMIAERTEAPSVVWYRRISDGWEKYVVEDKPLHIEAGSACHDIDGDGDIDVVFGGDYQSNEMWWWENPYPDFKPDQPWKRHLIKSFGAKKHHDQMFGDFDGDGQIELVFWNQGGRKLYLAEIPEEPHSANGWTCTEIYAWSNDSEMEQRGTYPGFKGVNEHEGLAQADIDGDGKIDIVGGGLWFKHVAGTQFLPNMVDAGYTFSRSGAGQLIEGGRPEIVLVVGDGVAPLILYEWQKGTWISKILLDEVDCGHSLAILDFNQDGKLDIWLAEMRLGGGNPDAKNLILLGDGKGNFETVEISSGIANHESKIADLDGDGDYDILGKPYGWETPRLDIWINESE